MNLLVSYICTMPDATKCPPSLTRPLQSPTLLRTVIFLAEMIFGYLEIFSFEDNSHACAGKCVCISVSTHTEVHYHHQHISDTGKCVCISVSTHSELHYSHQHISDTGKCVCISVSTHTQVHYRHQHISNNNDNEIDNSAYFYSAFPCETCLVVLNMCRYKNTKHAQNSTCPNNHVQTSK